jgi:hypothetical protein
LTQNPTHFVPLSEAIKHHQPELSESDIRQLWTFIEAFPWMGEADKALAYSLARRSLGKPVFATEDTEANQNT